MNCRECREEIEEYYAQALPPEEAAEAKAHIDACDGCAAEWHRLQQLTRLLERAPEVDPRVLPRGRRRLPFGLVTSAAALLLVVIGGALLLRGSQRATLREGAVGGEIRFGERLTVTTDRASVQLGRKGILTAEKGSAFTIESLGRVAVQSGRVEFEINKLGLGFVAATPRGEVEVVGTHFVVEVEMTKTQKAAAGVGTVSIMLLSGALIYRHGSEKHEIKPGEAVIARPDEPSRKVSVTDLEARLAEKDRRIADLEEALKRAPEAQPVGAVETPEQRRARKLRDFAKAMLRVRARDGRPRKDMTEEEGREFLKEMSKLMALASDPDLRLDSLNASGRMPLDVALALLEEGGIVKDAARNGNLRKMLDGLAEKEEALKNQDLWSSEYTVAGRRLTEELAAAVVASFPDAKEAAIVDLIAPNELAGSRSAQTNAVTREAAAQQVLTQWASELSLTDQERAAAASLASNYLQDYLALRRQAESQNSREFMDLYLLRVGQDKYAEAQREAMDWRQTNPEYAIRAWKLDTQFMELQTSYLRRLSALLPPEKREAFKKMNPYVIQYPYLE